MSNRDSLAVCRLHEDRAFLGDRWRDLLAVEGFSFFASAPDGEENSGILPELFAEAGDAERFASEEFLCGRIRNPHTRKAYLAAIRRFFT